MARIDDLLAQQSASAEAARKAKAEALSAQERARLRKAEVTRLWTERLPLFDKAVNEVNSRFSAEGPQLLLRTTEPLAGDVYGGEITVAGDRPYSETKSKLRLMSDGTFSVYTQSPNISPWTTREMKVEDLDEAVFRDLALDVIDAKLNPARSPHGR